MSDADNASFAKFVPGFDFLQNLAKGASASLPQMPNMGQWVAPTLNVEELDKRIGELKNVQFWLEQNSRALAATIQALEVQRMTLATLKGMNFNLADVANAFKLKPSESATATAQKASDKAQAAARTAADVASGVRKTAEKPAAKASAKAAEPASAPAGSGGMVDPLQLWGSLTQQFQHIAANAMKEVTSGAAADLTKSMASSLAQEALKTASSVVGKAPAAKKTAAKTPAKKAAKR